MPCLGCALPEPLNEPRFAILWPPQRHTLDKITRFLDNGSFTYWRGGEGDYITIDAEAPRRLITNLNGLLSDVEREDTRCLMTASREPGLHEFGNVLSINQFAARIRGDWLVSLLDEKRYVSHRQPIVSLDEKFDTIGHEYLFRGLDDDGGIVTPGALFESAHDPRILFNLDRTARISAVETAAKAKGEEKIFINFMPGSVYDPGVCLRTTVNAISKAEIDPRRVIFEIVESERVDDLGHLRGIINFYRSAGFRIALDDYGTGFNNLDTLMMLEPDYLKIDKSLVRQAGDGPTKRDLVEMLAERCRKNGIRTIGEGIEDLETAHLLRGCGIDYGQGYYFGKPAAPDQVAT